LKSAVGSRNDRPGRPVIERETNVDPRKVGVSKETF